MLGEKGMHEYDRYRHFDRVSDKEYLVLQEWKDTLRICREWLAQKVLPKFNLNNETI